MDGHGFDRVTRLLAAGGSRRGLLRLIAALPVAGAVATLLEESSEAKRRKRGKHADRQQDIRADKKRKNKKKRKHKKKPTCQPQTDAQTCVGKCGTVTNNCGQAVDCTCPAGNLCDGGTCVACTICPSGCPHTTVLAAVNAAPAGGTVRICPGTYSGANARVAINKNLTLIGAGDGTDEASNTILDGAAGGRVVETGAGRMVDLRNLRITGGSANAGSGLYNSGTTTMTNCTVTGNVATTHEGGGVLNNVNASLTMTNCTVSGNRTDSTIRDGGGFHNGGVLILDRCQVNGNTSARRGGGINNLANGGNVTLRNGTTVTGNTANGPGSSGGGIYNHGNATAVSIESGSSVTGNAPGNCAGTAITGCSG